MHDHPDFQRFVNATRRDRNARSRYFEGAPLDGDRPPAVPSRDIVGRFRRVARQLRRLATRDSAPRARHADEAHRSDLPYG